MRITVTDTPRESLVEGKGSVCIRIENVPSTEGDSAYRTPGTIYLSWEEAEELRSRLDEYLDGAG